MYKNILKEIENFNNLNKEYGNAIKNGKISSYLKFKVASNLNFTISFVLNLGSIALIIFSGFNMDFKTFLGLSTLCFGSPLLGLTLNYVYKKITKCWDFSDYLKFLSDNGYNYNYDQNYQFFNNINGNIVKKSKLNCFDIIKQIELLDERIISWEEKNNLLVLLNEIDNKNHYSVPIMVLNRELSKISTILKREEDILFSNDLKNKKEKLIKLNSIDIIKDFATEENQNIEHKIEEYLNKD